MSCDKYCSCLCLEFKSRRGQMDWRKTKSIGQNVLRNIFRLLTLWVRLCQNWCQILMTFTSPFGKITGTERGNEVHSKTICFPFELSTSFRCLLFPDSLIRSNNRWISLLYTQACLRLWILSKHFALGGTHRYFVWQTNDSAYRLKGFCKVKQVLELRFKIAIIMERHQSNNNQTSL